MKSSGALEYGLCIKYNNGSKEERWYKTPELRRKAENSIFKNIPEVSVVETIGKSD